MKNQPDNILCGKKIRGLFIGVLCSLMLIATQSYANESNQNKQVVSISRVRLEIGAYTYLWDNDGIQTIDKADETAGVDNTPVILPETIISFLSVYPGKTGKPEDIERWCRESELRLQNSGYVYTASVQIIPPRKNPDERTIYVSVSPGFFWRFGGGNAYGVFGKDCIGGKRASFRIYAGWNQNGMSYTNSHIAGLPLVAGASLFLYGPGENTTLTDAAGNNIAANRLEATETVGWFIQPDILIGIDISEAVDLFQDTTTKSEVSNGILPIDTLFSIQPFFSWNSYSIPHDPNRYGNESDSGFLARFCLFPVLPAAKGEASGFLHWRILPETTLACKASIGAATRAVSFSLFSVEDRSIRSGYTRDELSTSAFLYSSLELRQKITTILILQVFPLTLQTFLFSDMAGFIPAGTTIFASPEDNLQHQLQYANAWGAGLRILFDNPVFAYFTFSYGLNHEGKGRFLFYGTAGF